MAVTPSTAAKASALRSVRAPGRERARAGARHLLIDAPVEHVIERCGARGGERDAEVSPHQRLQRRHPGAREQRADDRGEGDERDNLRLGQLQIAAPDAPARPVRNPMSSPRCLREGQGRQGEAQPSRSRRRAHARSVRARLPCITLTERSSASVASSSNAAPAVCAVASHSGKALQHHRSMPMSSCRPSAASTAQATGLRAGQPAPAQHEQRGQRQRHARGRGAEAMGEMDGDARWIVEHAAFVVDVEAAPEHEGVAEVGVRPPGVLAGRQVWAGDGGVVAARPAAERDLQRERGERDEREAPGAPMGEAPPRRASAAARGRAARAPGAAAGSESRATTAAPASSCRTAGAASRSRGFSCQVTVSIPSRACTITVASSTSASGMLTRRWRRARIASALMSDDTRPSVPAA